MQPGQHTAGNAASRGGRQPRAPRVQHGGQALQPRRCRRAERAHVVRRVREPGAGATARGAAGGVRPPAARAGRPPASGGHAPQRRRAAVPCADGEGQARPGCQEHLSPCGGAHAQGRGRRGARPERTHAAKKPLALAYPQLCINAPSLRVVTGRAASIRLAYFPCPGCLLNVHADCVSPHMPVAHPPAPLTTALWTFDVRWIWRAPPAS
mmetsp:Transcript_13348/g.34598  ORF Transcript_13348/g.34598 Transcript_13348/m.34598 type:complete len:210 (+) Transcript_13348:609-1238(+)